MIKLYELLKEELELLETMINNTKNELKNFNNFSPDELFDLATEKEELMENFIFIKTEIDNYINSHDELNLEEYKDIFSKIENSIIIFKEENKKLMILTLSMQKLYDDLVENIDNSSIINMDI